MENRVDRGAIGFFWFCFFFKIIGTRRTARAWTKTRNVGGSSPLLSGIAHQRHIPHQRRIPQHSGVQ